MKEIVVKFVIDDNNVITVEYHSGILLKEDLIKIIKLVTEIETLD